MPGSYSYASAAIVAGDFNNDQRLDIVYILTT